MRLSEKKIFALGLFVTMLLLLVPLIIRIISYSGLPVGEEPYYYVKGAITPETPYEYLLHLFGQAQIFVPFMLGALSYVLFFFVLRQLKLSIEVRRLSVFMLLLTPAFIYSFTFINPRSLSIFFILLSVFLILNKNRYFKALAILPAAFAATFSFFDALLLIFLLCAYFFAIKRDKFFFIILPLIFIEALLYYLPKASNITLAQHNIIAGSVTDLGAPVGFSSFIILLAFIGFLTSWRKKSLAYASIFYLILAQIFFGAGVNSYIAFISAVLASQGLCWLIAHRWDLKLIRNLTVLLLVVGLVFSAANYVNNISRMEPTKELAQSLEWLGGQEKGTVISHYSNGFWINYFAEMPSFVDGFSSKERINAANSIFYSRNLSYTKTQLRQNKVRYIWIDPKMRLGEVWSKEEEGLLFLFRDNETFKRIYLKGSVEVWQINTS